MTIMNMRPPTTVKMPTKKPAPSAIFKLNLSLNWPLVYRLLFGKQFNWQSGLYWIQPNNNLECDQERMKVPTTATCFINSSALLFHHYAVSGLYRTSGIAKRM